MRVLLGATAIVALFATPAFAKSATCYTTDDGEYPCRFEFMEPAGSFKISAPGKPTFELYVYSPGEASAGAVFQPGGRSVALPGTYHRSKDDGACWVSDATDTEICAW